MKWFRERRAQQLAERQRQSIAELEYRGFRVNHLDRDGTEYPNAERAVKGAVLMVDSYTAARMLVLPDGRTRELFDWEPGNVDWTQPRQPPEHRV